MKSVRTKNIFKCLLVVFSWIYSTNLNSQVSDDLNVPTIGKPCPDFSLRNIQFYIKNNAFLKDFKGKWLVLDFWSSGCASCVASFPKINQLQNKFKNELQFILVGRDDKHIRPMYEKIRNKQGLELPVVYDTILFKQFDVQLVPYIIVIDDKGIVQGITVSLSEINIQDFLAGKRPMLRKALNRQELDARNRLYDNKEPLLINGNGGYETDFLYRSIITGWNPQIPQYASQFIRLSGNMVQVTGMPLRWLYQMAYSDTISNYPFNIPNSYGKYWNEPILELSDSSEFEIDFLSGKNLFCYSLIVPDNKANARYMQEVMQRDLKNYFGFDVSVQTRVMPCWKLISSKSINLKNNISKPKEKILENDGYSGPISKLLSTIWYFNQNEPPFFNETGFKDDIYVTLDAVMTDFNDIKKALRKNNLELVKSEKSMKVIVIKEKL